MIALAWSKVRKVLQMEQIRETESGYAVALTPHGAAWTWSVYDLDGEPSGSGREVDRESAWRSGLFAAGAITALRRVARRRF